MTEIFIQRKHSCFIQFRDVGFCPILQKIDQQSISLLFCLYI